jgi:hypothetical protein
MHPNTLMRGEIAERRSPPTFDNRDRPPRRHGAGGDGRDGGPEGAFGGGAMSTKYRGEWRE